MFAEEWPVTASELHEPLVSTNKALLGPFFLGGGGLGGSP